MSTPYPQTEIIYPHSDGQPMAESDFQRKPLAYAVDSLSSYFQDQPDVYVSGNMFIYYEEGNPKAVVAPDVFVVLGANKKDRWSFKLWQEPKGPDFVLEVTSKSTKSEDQGPKRGTYAYLGVSEYWQYDPTGDYLTPPLQGLRLQGENYERIPTAVGTGGVLALPSAVLGLELHYDKKRGLRFYDTVADQYLLNYQELQQRQLQTETRIAELEAQLRALQKHQ